MAIRDFTDLLIWQRSIEMAKGVYVLTRQLPREEMYGLSSQIRRAVVSVSSNIAEGHARQGREYAHFLSIARGSLAEVESQLLLCVELDYLSADSIVSIRDEAAQVHRMIAGLAAKLPPK